MTTASLGAGEVAFAARLATDAALVGLLGTDDAGAPLVVHGWPADLLELDDPPRSAFPRLTYFRAGSLKAARASGDLLLQVDVWVDYGEKETLEAIDTRVLELVDEVSWDHDGVRVTGRAIGGEFDTPASPRRPLNRRRNLWIGVN